MCHRPFTRVIIAHMLAGGAVATALCGCGADVVASAAGVANLNAAQARQAQQLRSQTLRELEATQQAAAARAASSAVD